jgi:hypothetical protein
VERPPKSEASTDSPVMEDRWLNRDMTVRFGSAVASAQIGVVG